MLTVTVCFVVRHYNTNVAVRVFLTLCVNKNFDEKCHAFREISSLRKFSLKVGKILAKGVKCH
jgi:hypothetical protein